MDKKVEKMENRRKVASFRLDPEVADEFAEYAIRNGFSISRALEYSMRQTLHDDRARNWIKNFKQNLPIFG